MLDKSILINHFELAQLVLWNMSAHIIVRLTTFVQMFKTWRTKWIWEWGLRILADGALCFGQGSWMDCKSTLTQWLMGHVVAEVTNEDRDHEALTEPPPRSLHGVKGCHLDSPQTLWGIQFALSQAIFITIFFPWQRKNDSATNLCVMFLRSKYSNASEFHCTYTFILFVHCYISSNVEGQPGPHDLQLLYI